MAIGFRPKGLFGANSIASGDDPFKLQTPMSAPPPAQEARGAGGFLGAGGPGRAIAGAIGDVLLQRSGARPFYQPIANMRLAQQARAQRDASVRQQAFNDRRAQYDYELAHPKPVNNDTVADYNFWKQTLPPDQFNTWLQNKVNPPQYRQGPDGQYYRIETPTASSPPTFTADDWNSGQPVGGPASSAPGMFP